MAYIQDMVPQLAPTTTITPPVTPPVMAPVIAPATSPATSPVTVTAPDADFYRPGDAQGESYEQLVAKLIKVRQIVTAQKAYHESILAKQAQPEKKLTVGVEYMDCLHRRSARMTKKVVDLDEILEHQRDALVYFAAMQVQVEEPTHLQLFEARNELAISDELARRSETKTNKMVAQLEATEDKIVQIEAKTSDVETALAKSKALNEMWHDVDDAIKDKYVNQMADATAQHNEYIATITAAHVAKVRETKSQLQLTKDNLFYSEIRRARIQNSYGALDQRQCNINRICADQSVRITELENWLTCANETTRANKAEYAELLCDLNSCRADLKNSQDEVASTRANLQDVIASQGALKRSAESDEIAIAVLKQSSDGGVRPTARAYHRELTEQRCNNARVISRLHAQSVRQRTEIGKLTRTNKELATTVTDLQDTLSRRDSEFDSLKYSTDETMSSEKDELQRTTTAYKAIKRKIAHQVEENASAINEQQLMISVLQSDNDDLAVQVQRATDTFNYANDRANRAEKTCNLLKRTLSVYQETATTDLGKIARLEKVTTQLNADARVVAERASSTEACLKSSNTMFEKVIKKLHGAKKGLKAEISSITDQLKESHRQYDLLNTDRIELTTERDSLNRKLAAPTVCGCAAEAQAIQAQYEQYAHYIDQTATAAVNNLNQELSQLNQQLDAKNRQLDVKDDMFQRVIGEQLRCKVLSHHRRRGQAKSCGVSK